MRSWDALRADSQNILDQTLIKRWRSDNITEGQLVGSPWSMA
jgi:hypothetical protein